MRGFSFVVVSVKRHGNSGNDNSDPGTSGKDTPVFPSTAEKQDALRGAGAALAVLVAVLASADAASAFFVCLAVLAMMDAALATAVDFSTDSGPDAHAHVWWLAALYLVFLYVLTPWWGFPIGGVDAFAFAGSV